MFQNTGEARKFRAYFALGMYALTAVVAATTTRLSEYAHDQILTVDTFAIWYGITVGTALLAYNGITYKKYLASL